MKTLGTIAKVLLFAALYAAAGILGRRIDFVQENYRVLWPQAGVALAGLIVLGLRYWPGVLLGSLGVTLSARFFPDIVGIGAHGKLPSLSWTSVTILAACNTVSALAGAWAFVQWRKLDRTFGAVRDVTGFLICAGLLAPLINACLTVPMMVASQPALGPEWFALWWRRVFGHGISHLIVSPVFMTWSRRSTTLWPRRRVLELVLLVSIFVLVCQALFTGQYAIANLSYPASFAPFPFVIWAALRFGPRGSASSTFLVAAIAILGTSRGFGPFANREVSEGLVLLQVYLMAIGVSGLFLAAAVAERRTAMAELRGSREQLRALSAKLETSREEERARLSREIHDELGQQLTSLKIGIKNLRKRMMESTGCPPELIGRFDRLAGVADDAVQSVRRIASDLRPGMLDELGLVAALQWQTRQFQERTGVEANFASNAERLEISPELSTAMFRIVQESLTNVAKHSNATRVDVELLRQDGRINVSIRDNGVGFLPADRTGAQTLGILGMHERTRLLGGEMKVSSTGEETTEPAGGTTISASFPLEATAS